VNGKLSWSIFWALIGFTIVIGGFLFIPIPALGAFRMSSFLFPSMVSAGAIFLLLGVTLIVLTVREKVGGMLRKFFLLTGASAPGIIVSILLHSAVYALFIYFFGEDFWTRVGLEDEPFFFMMAIFVCPLGFLVGAIGSIVIRVKEWWTERKLASSL
jgi:hypothetical protein